MVVLDEALLTTAIFSILARSEEPPPSEPDYDEVRREARWLAGVAHALRHHREAAVDPASLLGRIDRFDAWVAALGLEPFRRWAAALRQEVEARDLLHTPRLRIA